MTQLKHPFDFTACDLSQWDGDTSTCRWCNGELPRHRVTSHPSVFCTPTCTWEWKQHHVWASAKRHRAQEDRWTCLRCGKKSAIPEVHHIQPCGGNRHPSCLHHQANLQTLCADCHAAAHASGAAA